MYVNFITLDRFCTGTCRLKNRIDLVKMHFIMDEKCCAKVKLWYIHSKRYILFCLMFWCGNPSMLTTEFLYCKVFEQSLIPSGFLALPCNPARIFLQTIGLLSYLQDLIRSFKVRFLPVYLKSVIMRDTLFVSYKHVYSITAVRVCNTVYVTTHLLKSSIFWDTTPCSPLNVNWRFEGTCRRSPSSSGLKNKPMKKKQF
jgi:hypothetical protein